MKTDVNFREMMGTAKFYESYSRYDDTLQRYETWDESVDRVMNMHRDYYSEKMNDVLDMKIMFATKFYKDKKVLGAQRALQFGGEQLLKHQTRLYNCTSSYCDRPEFFGEMFYLLLSGAGTGMSLQKHHVVKLPPVHKRNKQSKEFVVEDSIEGWAESLDVLMSSFFVGGGKHPEYEGRKIYFNTTGIRPKGAKISGGFKAPGPDPLVKALNHIERRITEYLDLCEDDECKMPPIEYYDICMFAADAVLAGGVRRSATIVFFSADDEDMITAKTGDWFSENPQRARSNNSVVLIRKDTTRSEFSKIMKSVKEFGEPGFAFFDSTEHLSNPCFEIGMYPVEEKTGKSGWQGCNLTEINGGECKTEDDFYLACEASAILGTLQAGYTDFKFLDETSAEIYRREALLGVSVTGWMNAPKVLFKPEVMKKGAEIVKRVNKEVAEMIGINPAARTTCTKPAGNSSTLLGTASGIHPEHSKRYIRNMQMNKEIEVAKMFKTNNPYMVEDSVWSTSGSDYVISFPVEPQRGSIFKDKSNGIELLEKVRMVQEHWVGNGRNDELCVDPTVTHNVSNTITVHGNDWDEVEEYVYDNRYSFSGISFLSGSGDKDYAQAPFTSVLTAREIITKYGDAGVFASGLIVDSHSGFSSLWEACMVAQSGDTADKEISDHRNDWVRRFQKFADTYFDGDMKETEYCLKDVHMLHKWNKIVANFEEMDFDEIEERRFTDIDTMGAQACAGGVCDIT